MKNKTCIFCNNGQLTRGVKLQTHTYQGFTLEVNQSGDWCDNCDEGILNPDDLESTRKEIEEFQNNIEDHFNSLVGITEDDVTKTYKYLNGK